MSAQRYNRATRPTQAERTTSGVLSDREIDRRIKELGEKVRRESLRATTRVRRGA